MHTPACVLAHKYTQVHLIFRLRKDTQVKDTHTLKSVTGVFTGAILRCSPSLPRHTKASLSTHFSSSEPDLPLQDRTPAGKLLTQAVLVWRVVLKKGSITSADKFVYHDWLISEYITKKTTVGCHLKFLYKSPKCRVSPEKVFRWGHEPPISWRMSSFVSLNYLLDDSLNNSKNQ